MKDTRVPSEIKLQRFGGLYKVDMEVDIYRSDKTHLLRLHHLLSHLSQVE